MLKVKLPATTANLGSGYDSIGAALNIFNFIELEETDNGLLIEVEGEGKDIIEKNKSNLVYKAVRKVFEKTGTPLKGLKIKLINNIPIARGLGSSAACIVGGILGANYLLSKPLPDEELLKIAVEMEGHPDNIVPAFLGGVVVSCLSEQGITHMKLNGINGLKFVVVVPDFMIETSLSRKVVPQTVDIKDATYNIGRASLLAAGLALGNLEVLKEATKDRLHQPYRNKLIPGMMEVINAAEANGALGSFLSGSGPTVIALANNNIEAIGLAMEKAFKQEGIDSKVYITELCLEGAKLYVEE